MMYSPFPKPYHGGVLRQTLDVSRRARSRAFIAPSPALFDARVGRSAPIAFCFSFSNVFFTFSNKQKMAGKLWNLSNLFVLSLIHI